MIKAFLLGLILLPICLALQGCAGTGGGTTVSDVATALAKDPANSCVTVNNSVAGYLGSFTYIHQGNPAAAAPTCK